MGASQSTEEEASQALHQLAAQNTATNAANTNNNNNKNNSNVNTKVNSIEQQNTHANNPTLQYSSPSALINESTGSPALGQATAITNKQSLTMNNNPQTILTPTKHQLQELQQPEPVIQAQSSNSQIPKNSAKIGSTSSNIPVSVTPAISSPSRVTNSKSPPSIHAELMYSLVEWISPLLPVGVALAYDTNLIERSILSLSTTDIFKQILTEKAIERIKKRRAEHAARLSANHTGQPISSIFNDNTAEPSFTGAGKIPNTPPNSSINIPWECAEKLLQADKNLSGIRLHWVPSKVSENMFWFEYFNLILDYIAKHVLQAQQAIRNHSIQTNINTDNNYPKLSTR